MTSASWVIGVSAVKARTATSPAARGPVAKTAECILTPLGMPIAGTEQPIAWQMLRAVPSPPAKSRSSTRSPPSPRRALGVGGRGLSGDRGADQPRVPPGRARDLFAHALRRGQRQEIGDVGLGDDRQRCAARVAERGTAPRARACATISGPSVPFSPTQPPMPAMGLTISPSVRGVTAAT